MEFNLTPHPRILVVLGEIVLAQWKCIAELIDNSVDSFLEAKRAESPITDPVIKIITPTSANQRNGMITVKDNGPGMSKETLEKAVKAGWTSHDPIENLGLFGMGFNIATARLGGKTTVLTTRKNDYEWIGVEIDFEMLIKKQTFISSGITRPKTSPDDCGTMITIEKLKPEQLEWFSKSYNRNNMIKTLGKVYSSMLSQQKTPIGFRMELNSNKVLPRLHCIWGENREVSTSSCGIVKAFQPIDCRLNDRPFCVACLNWLSSETTKCPICNQDGTVRKRPRRIHGWIGIQRFVDKDKYGIDFLRNGRKIELDNKDLFTFTSSDDGETVKDYPIDDPRNRGRIVGEIHVDHCRVPYTKDRFVREDSSWQEMTEVIRGKTSLQPQRAALTGSGENNSPLFRLFQAFRRNSPANKVAGSYAKLLVVPDVEVAQQMAEKFYDGEPEYITDKKWYELIEEADTALLTTPTTPGTSISAPAFVVQRPGSIPPRRQGELPLVESSSNSNGPGSQQAQNIVRKKLPSLCLTAFEDVTQQAYEVEAFEAVESDPELMEDCPWSFKKTAAGKWLFIVERSNNAFRSITLNPMDALIAQISYTAADIERGRTGKNKFGEILTNLRTKYLKASSLNPDELIAEAKNGLDEIAKHMIDKYAAPEFEKLFNSLGEQKKESIRANMARRSVSNPSDEIKTGSFIRHADPYDIVSIILDHPDLYFDARFWPDLYAEIDFGSETATSLARERVLGEVS